MPYWTVKAQVEVLLLEIKGQLFSWVINKANLRFVCWLLLLEMDVFSCLSWPARWKYSKVDLSLLI